MNRLCFFLGLSAGIILILIALMHSLIGWQAAKPEFVQAGLRTDLLQGLLINWHFGSVGTLTLGVVVVVLVVQMRRGQPVPSFLPLVLIGCAYCAYGVWALIVADMNPFFCMFILPGTLLVLMPISISKSKSKLSS